MLGIHFSPKSFERIMWKLMHSLHVTSEEGNSPVISNFNEKVMAPILIPDIRH
jgi:hypothetical protein